MFGPLIAPLLLTLALVPTGQQAVGATITPTPEATAAEARRAQQERLRTFAQGTVTAGQGLQPRLIKQVNPKYTPGPMRAKVQGKVVLFAIVGVDGKVTRSAVDVSLDPELDLQALEALSQWAFAPTLLNGKPTPVAVAVEMEFRVH